jgi:antitoxin component of MazEF toxin-antitoxin module
MPLTRKTRVSGSSIVITIPSQLVKAYNLSSGDSIEIVPINPEEIIIRKINGKGGVL